MKKAKKSKKSAKKSALKTIFKVLGILTGVYGILFLVYYFDLDGKALYNFVEPAMKERFDKMERRNPLERPYDMISGEYMGRKN